LRIYTNAHLTPFFGIEDIRDIHTKHVKAFADTMPVSLSPKSRKNILDCLRKFFKDMKTLEVIDKVPVFPEIKVPEPAFNWCDINTQERILEQIPRIHWPIMWFIAKQGVRPSEARALHWEDLDLENDMVCIRRTFSLNELRMTTKGKHADWLPLHPRVKELILELPRGISGFVFKFKGKPYNEKLPRDLWDRACKKLEISGLKLYHGTRHSVASDAVQRGVSIYDVKDALRHKDIRTTMRYAHLDMIGKKRVILGDKVVAFPLKKKKGE
jgi:integrase